MKQPLGQMSQKLSWTKGTTRMSQFSWTTQRSVDKEKGQVAYSFMAIPEYLCPLLGRHLLTKMGAHIRFNQTGITETDLKGEALHVLTMSLIDEYKLFTRPPGSNIKWRLTTKMAKQNSPGYGQRLGNLVWQHTGPPY